MTDRINFPLGLREQDERMYARGWNDAIAAAANIADNWMHRGDPGVAMYAGPRIRDRIKALILYKEDK